MSFAENHEASSLTVGVCPTCDELLTLSESEFPSESKSASRRIVCPHCDATIALVDVRRRVARSAVAVAETPTAEAPATEAPAAAKAKASAGAPPKTPTLSEALGWTTAATPDPQSDDTEHQRLVNEADELLKSVEQSRELLTTPEPAAPDTSEAAAIPTEARASLSAEPTAAETSLADAETTAAERIDAGPIDPTPIDAGPLEQAPIEPRPTSELLKEFGFDFGATPLKSEPASPSAPRVAAEASIDIEVRQPAAGDDRESTPSASLAGARVERLLSEADDERNAEPKDDGYGSTAAELLLTGADDATSGGWAGPLMAAAGVLLIAGPATYLAWSGVWGGTAEPSAAAMRAPLQLGANDTVVDPPIPQRAVPQLPVPQPMVSQAPIPQESVSTTQDPYDSSEPKPLVVETDDRYSQGQIEPATYEVDALEAGSQAEPPAEWALPPEQATPPEKATPEQAPPADQATSPAAAPLDSRYERQAATEASEPEMPDFALPGSGAADEPPALPPAFASEPAPASGLEQPAAALPPAPSVSLPVAGAPTYTTDQLLALAQQSGADAAAFAAGSLSDTEQAPLLGQAYARLCKLCEAVTLLDPRITRRDRREGEFAALDVYNKLWLEDEPRESSRVIARHWIEWPERPHGGVFFAGKPNDEPRKAGDVFRYEFELQGVVVPVVTSEKLDVRRFLSAQAREIGVLGVVVEAPAERIAGYVGDDQRVVWARKTIPLREPGKL